MAIKNKSSLDKMNLMTLMTQVKPGGIIDEDETRTLKNFTFILKGKRTLEMQAYDEEEAKVMFEADPIYSSEKVIDVIESDIVEHAPTQIHPTGGNSVKTVTETNPAVAKANFAETFARLKAEGEAIQAAEAAAKEPAVKVVKDTKPHEIKKIVRRKK